MILGDRVTLKVVRESLKILDGKTGIVCQISKEFSVYGPVLACAVALDEAINDKKVWWLPVEEVIGEKKI